MTDRGSFGRWASPHFRRIASLYLRRAGIGLAAGLLGSPLLLASSRTGGIAIVAAGVAGAAYGLWFRFPRRAYAEGLMTGATLGVPLWAFVSVVVLPMVSGATPRWSAAGMRALLPQFVGWVLFGAALGVAAQALFDAALRWLGPEARPPRESPALPKHVVILGGGFAGVSTALELERCLGPDPGVVVTLVSDSNALVFTPMLAEVAGSSLEPTHITSPIRTSLRRTQVVRGAVTEIDLPTRMVRVAGEKPLELHFEHLVLALGAVTNSFGIEGVSRHCQGFKSLGEAIHLRNQVIDVFERAAWEQELVRRRELLTFVVAGGGFAGVEVAGALNDFARGMLADFPTLRAEDVKVKLIHPGDRILPELSPTLAAYALDRMTARGVEFLLGARVADARPGCFVLKSGEEIRGQTLVWTAGSTPNPLLRRLGMELSRRGAVVVDGHLAAPGHRGVWAAGDCAAVPDARTGEPCPPTAQFALRQARRLARNVHAALRGHPPRLFQYEALGTLCVVGHHTACAELRIPFTHRHVHFSGLLAWLMWRTIYLSKLPGVERKVRVLSDWTLELFFPRDIVQTIEINSRTAGIGERAP